MDASKPRTLRLSQLSEGIPALTPVMGAMQAESAAFCLERQGHPEVVDLMVSQCQVGSYQLHRMCVTDAVRRSCADETRSAEFGAYGIAILLALQETGRTAVQAARKGGGFDYWLADPSQDPNTLPFHNAARLEVSGILKGSDSQFAARIKQKKKQSEPSDNLGIPAFSVVVEYSTPRADLSQRV